MDNFVYDPKTRIIFGQDQIQALKEELPKLGVKKMLLVYGQSSIKKLGIYDEIIKMTSDLEIEVFEESNVRPNPDIRSVRNGIKTCKAEEIDFVLAAGGGSVIDCAKAIAFGVYYEGDVWDIYLRKADSMKSLPIGVVITLAATGSETNGNSVISNDETGQKLSVKYDISRPAFAIIDPSYTLHVDEHHTFAGSIDMMMHIFEQYFSPSLRTDTSDYMSLGVVKSVIENTRRILSGHDDYQVRANLSWASTLAWNWILGVDKVQDWATHRLSYPVTKEYGTTHAYALAILFPAWMKVALKHNPEVMVPKLSLLGRELFGNSNPAGAIEELRSLFRSFKASTSFEEEGIHLSDEKIDYLVKETLLLGPVGNVIKVDEALAKEIFYEAKES
ncbi:MAG: iron-containing alcohol dehydrogenase [Candidatus Izemoplasmataceae bacterium]